MESCFAGGGEEKDDVNQNRDIFHMDTSLHHGKPGKLVGHTVITYSWGNSESIN